MNINRNRNIFRYLKPKISIWIIIPLIIVFLSSFVPVSWSQTLINLPTPGTMVHLTDARFPVILKGINIDVDDPLRLSFIIDTGDDEPDGDQFEEQASKLIKYFLVALTVPENDLWVNLSPYEDNRIIADDLGKTRLGIDMLAQDYMLKQLTSSLMYPEDELGQKFWDGIYEKAYEEYGTTEIPVNTFNKVWIVPDKAVVYEYKGGAVIVESRMKVLLEQDYIALQENLKNPSNDPSYFDPEERVGLREETSNLIRGLIIPEIEKEVNEGATFENLRQMYRSIILALWYKANLKESIISKAYVDKNKIDGVQIDDVDAHRKIYDKYLEAFKVGVFNYVKEDYDESAQDIVDRKYFSGGVHTRNEEGKELSQVVKEEKLVGTDRSMLGVGNAALKANGRYNSVDIQLQPRGLYQESGLSVSERFFSENGHIGEGGHVFVYRHPAKEGKVLKRFKSNVRELIRDHHIAGLNKLLDAFKSDEILADSVGNMYFIRVYVDGVPEWMIEMDHVKGTDLMREIDSLNGFSDILTDPRASSLQGRAFDILRRIDDVSTEVLGTELADRHSGLFGDDGEDFENFIYLRDEDKVVNIDPINIMRMMLRSVDSQKIIDIMSSSERSLGVEEGLFSQKIGGVLGSLSTGMLFVENALIDENPKAKADIEKLVLKKSIEILARTNNLKLEFRRNAAERVKDNLPTFVPLSRRKNVGGRIAFIRDNKNKRRYDNASFKYVQMEDEVLGSLDVILPEDQKDLEHNAGQSKVLELLGEIIDQRVDERFKDIFEEAEVIDDSEDNVGGIDFNSEILGIDSVGDKGSSFEGWGVGDINILPKNFSGFVPVILDVKPIYDLPLLISGSETSDPFEVSYR